MRKEALKMGYDVEVDSAYRSYDYQQKVLDDFYSKMGEEAYKVVALPGTSEQPV
jgi:LAS superfamily LD-carboxypeptidase LdcB